MSAEIMIDFYKSVGSKDRYLDATAQQIWSTADNTTMTKRKNAWQYRHLLI